MSEKDRLGLWQAWRPVYGSDSCVGAPAAGEKSQAAENALNPGEKVLWGILHALAFCFV